MQCQQQRRTLVPLIIKFTLARVPSRHAATCLRYEVKFAPSSYQRLQQPLTARTSEVMCLFMLRDVFMGEAALNIDKQEGNTA